MSSKVTDVLEELFDQKTQCIIYFWKPLVKSRSMMMTLVIFDSNQEGQGDLYVLHGDKCSWWTFWPRDSMYFQETSDQIKVNDDDCSHI